MSTMPEMTSTGFCRSSAVNPAAAVTGQTSTHLPQRVQASAMASARACKANSNVSATTFMRASVAVAAAEYRRLGPD